MPIENNIDDQIKHLDAFKAALLNGSPLINDAIFSGLNAGAALMKQRIFNDGLSADGIPFGKYTGKKTKLTSRKYSLNNDPVKDSASEKIAKSLRKSLSGSIGEGLTEYEKKRLAFGRQIARKDLEFEGSLRRSIETQAVRTDNVNTVAVVIGDAESQELARFQEQQIGNILAEANPVYGKARPEPIFQFSKDEYEYAITEGNAALSEAIKILFDGTK